MLQQILGAHSQVYTVADPWLMLHPIYVMRRSGIVTEFDSYWANIGLKDYLSTLDKKTEVLYDIIKAYAKVLYNASLQNKKEKFF